MTDADLFKRGMRRLASGVSIVTTMDETTPQGFVATSVTSVCAAPSPLLLVCVNREVSSHGAIHRSKMFCVNLLSETDAELARLFSSSARRERRFAQCEWRALTTGAPALSVALASFDCEVQTAIDVESHTVFLGKVVAIELSHDAIQPLLYVDGRFDALRSFSPSAALS
jgi:flavin reductase